MKRIPVICCLLAAFNCNGDEAAAKGADEQLAAAKGAIKTLAETLKGELQTAMQAGGPSAAIELHAPTPTWCSSWMRLRTWYRSVEEKWWSC